VSDESWKDQERAMRQGLERTSAEMLAYGDNGILAEVAIGRRLVVEATRSFNRSVARARAEGFTWEQIAEQVPGYVRAYGDEAGEALYDEVAVVSADLQERYVSWRCGDCQALVLDQGPYGGHPADVEPGAAGLCPSRQGSRRLRHRAQWRGPARARRHGRCFRSGRRFHVCSTARWS
jgi:hypothetical protein